MKSAEKQTYPPIEDSVPFNGIFSAEQIKTGRKLFLKKIRQDRKDAMKILAQKSFAANLEASAT